MESSTQWRTSTRTQGQGQCVEVGFGAGRIAVRDTKDRTAGYFTVTTTRWQRFVSGVKLGDFDS